MDWKSNYKSMDIDKLIAEYQRVLTANNSDPAKADKLNFLKMEFAVKSNKFLTDMVI